MVKMLFFEQGSEDKIKIVDLSTADEEEMKEVIRRALDGEIEGIPGFRFSKTNYEFSTIFILEFVENFNSVIGSTHPDKILSIESSSEKIIVLSQLNGTKITIEL